MGIKPHQYSWECRPSKRRWTWGRVLGALAGIFFILALVGGTAAFTAFAFFKNKYQGIANGFDLEMVRKMEAASVLFDRTGREMGKIFIQNRNPVPLSEISPNLVQAVIAAEDTRFYEHKGVDWMGVARAMVENWRQGRIAQGASTVTQQLARNSFEMRERTFERKFIEMFLAQRIEGKFTKDEIMEMYLNRVYFGSGLYGADAAARGYFGKPAKELSIGEAATLAGLLRSPQALSPWNNPRAARNIRDVVLHQMRDQGFITREQLRAELAAPLNVRPRTNMHRVSYANDLIRQQSIAALGFEQAMNGGFRIFTTMDLDLQEAAEKALLQQLDRIESRPGYSHETYAAYRDRYSELEKKIDRGDPSTRLPAPKYLQGALLALDNANGGILAMVGGRDFRHSEYNRALQARRPVGTAFTPFVFAAGYENGLSPTTVVDDGCIDNRYVMVGGATGILGEWGVERSDNDYEGQMTAKEALVKGKNAATVRFGLQLGLNKLKEFVARLGIKSPLRQYANAYLGSSELTLAEITQAYLVFPNQGRKPTDFHIIERIENADGKVIYQHKASMERVMSGVAAFQTHLALEEVLTRGTEGLAQSRDGLKNFPVAGKNGTAYGFTDTYFFGYNSAVTVGVWIGFDKPQRIYRGAFGRDLAMPVWAKVMNRAAEIFPPAPFRRPLEVEAVEVCAVSGLAATPKCVHEHQGQQIPTTYIEYLTAAQKPESICDVHAGGVRSYAQVYNEEEWPRAAPAMDLSLVRPVAVQQPTLLGFNDVYQSVQPGAMRVARGEEIPVAKALPVEYADGTTADAGELGTTEGGVPVAAAIPVQASGGEGAEVRPAGAGPGVMLLERPALEPAQPAPARF